MKHKSKLSSRPGKALIGLVCLGLAYLVFLRAAHTGSLQQYAILIALFVYGLNRIGRAILNK